MHGCLDSGLGWTRLDLRVVCGKWGQGSASEAGSPRGTDGLWVPRSCGAGVPNQSCALGLGPACGQGRGPRWAGADGQRVAGTEGPRSGWRSGTHSTVILGDDLLGQQDAAVHLLLLADHGASAAAPSSV